jgi:alkanesulfonate monooxygenase SsuD/methylene tetrahydromethanopterin reductase-like flavin-dependent oxidoreductase (luciferase family)
MTMMPNHAIDTARSFQAPSTVPDSTLEVFSTCASVKTGNHKTYLGQIAAVARWSEEIGCKGILVYSENSLVDPWLVAQVIIENTHALCPLIAVQPIYMHPYTVAKMVTTLGNLYGRRVYLNMIAGGFKNDLLALNDETAHDKRYDRIREYTNIIKDLLTGSKPVSFAGEFYTVDKLKLLPALDQDLFPGIFISGSSEAGLATARAPYWLIPFQNYKTACPYLVGSYERVGQELAGYIAAGYRTLILDIPPDLEELVHTRNAINKAGVQSL